MTPELLKKHLQERAEQKVAEFQNREDIVCKFDKPILAYIDAENVLFDALFARGLNDHPKKIYRPGKCIVLHYTPYAEEIVRRNEDSFLPTEEWIRAYMESLWLAMELNRTIVETLSGQGRLTSYLNSMMEWDPSKGREGWSHKLTAAIGGVGKIGPAGSLIVNGRYGGRAGGIITDGLYAERAPRPEGKELEAKLKEMLFEAEHPVCSTEMVECCPGGAISEEGIDRFKCQKYCLTLNKNIPLPEVCGKCFRFGI
ncbi:MAG: hypothetical protein Q4A40_03560 [Bacillota bacterium]|nr:hypothetical protein [Bacillota bacterium]